MVFNQEAGGVQTPNPGSGPIVSPPEEEIPPTESSLEYERIMLYAEVIDEKLQVAQAYDWHLKEHVHVTPALLNAGFSPADPQWRALRLQERGYDREIERKIRVLIDMQKARRAQKSKRKMNKNKSLKTKRISASKRLFKTHDQIRANLLNQKDIAGEDGS